MWGKCHTLHESNTRNWPGAAPTDFLCHVLQGSFLAKPVNEKSTQAEIMIFNTSHGQVQVYWKEKT